MENEIPTPAGAEKIQHFARPIRVAIVEDMKFLAEMTGHLCKGWGLEVVALSTTGNEGHDDVVRTKPDVVLLDLSLPDMDGVALAGKINAALPATRIIVISGSWNDYQIHRLTTVNFHGFVDKSAEGLLGLRRAIELVHQGGSYFSPRYLRASRRLRQSDGAFFKRLSFREQEVLLWVAQALSDEEIAAQLELSATTVQTHKREIMHKLNIHSTPKLIRYGMELGMCFGPMASLALTT